MQSRTQAQVIKKLQIASSALDDAVKMLREAGATPACVLAATAQRNVADAILKTGGSGDEAPPTREVISGLNIRPRCSFEV